MITGKIAGVHITTQSIRVVESEISRGRIEIINALSIPNAARFFSHGRLINLVSLVETISMSMHSCGMAAKRLSISFDNAFQTSFSIEPVKRRNKKQSLNISFGKKKDNNGKPDIDDNGGATVRKQHSWGEFITQDEQGEAVSVIVGEKDLLNSLSAAFASCGYKVLSIEPPDTSLIYTRNTVDYSYDSLNKIVVYAENDEIGDLYILTKDVPSTIKRIQFDSVEGATLGDRVRELCQIEITAGQMRNPYIFLLGDAFKDMDTYIKIAEDLDYEGMQVSDLYGLVTNPDAAEGEVDIVISEEADSAMPEITPEYGICICQLLRCFDTEPENLAPRRLPTLISSQATSTAMKVLQIAAIIFLVFNVVLTGLTAFEAISIRSSLQDTGALHAQLNETKAEKAEAEIQLAALNAIDPRLAEVFNFIYENVDPSLNIASVDTVDMLPTAEDSESKYAEESNKKDDKTENGEESSVERKKDTSSATPSVESAIVLNQKQLIIRGYSTKSNGTIALYNALNRAGIGEVRLVGHQQVELPSGELIYIFELSAG